MMLYMPELPLKDRQDNVWRLGTALLELLRNAAIDKREREKLWRYVKVNTEHCHYQMFDENA